MITFRPKPICLYRLSIVLVMPEKATEDWLDLGIREGKEVEEDQINSFEILDQKALQILGLIGFSSGIIPFVAVISPFIGADLSSGALIFERFKNSPNILWGILYLILATVFSLLSYNVSSIAKGSKKSNLEKFIAEDNYNSTKVKKDIISDTVDNIEFNTNSILRKSVLLMCGLLSLVYSFSLIVAGILNQTSEALSAPLLIPFYPLVIGACFLTVLLYAFLPMATASLTRMDTPVTEMRGGVPEYNASKIVDKRSATLVAIVLPPAIITSLTILYMVTTKHQASGKISNWIGVVLFLILLLSILITAMLYWRRSELPGVSN
jgi:uncharacterized membrane protein